MINGGNIVTFEAPITIAKALDRIYRRDYVLPAIQREFVWGRDKIIRLFDSLMRGYPIGSFLMWQVEPENAGRFTFYDFMLHYHERDNPHCAPMGPLGNQRVTAVLDGQQRLTALNIALRGSHARKLPRMWANNPQAYPKTEVYVDLFHRGQDDELGIEFDFRFLTPAEAAGEVVKANAHWYPVRSILEVQSIRDVLRTLQREKVADHDTAGEVLARLQEVVHLEPSINYFLEDSQALDKVLNIFIRVNSGGTVLSYSDLLLSVATAQWKERDAREAVHRLVDDLNSIGQGFTFSKDLVLKSGLVMLDKNDIRFKVDNFDRATMADLEKRWDEIGAALRLGASLLADFGFSAATLTANSVLIPMADYVNRRGVGENYRTGSAHREDRAALRRWAQRSLMKAGVWGSGLDTLLTGLRSVIRQYGAQGWPSDALDREMARQGKQLRFDPTEIDDLLELEYGAKRLFPMLAMLYPIDTRNQFHEDHLFPRSVLVSRKKLRKYGIDEDDMSAIIDCADRAANLQLLRGPENQSKSDQLPDQWLRTQFSNESDRQGWLREYDAMGLPDDISGFLDFYQRRRARMRERLAALLDVDLTARPATAAPAVPSGDSGDEPDPGNEGL
jgi:hypothetical protein